VRTLLEVGLRLRALRQALNIKRQPVEDVQIRSVGALHESAKTFAQLLKVRATNGRKFPTSRSNNATAVARNCVLSLVV